MQAEFLLFLFFFDIQEVIYKSMTTGGFVGS
jgi:hypothetical protein